MVLVIYIISSISILREFSNFLILSSQVLELSLLLRFGFTSDRERVTDWAASFPALAARANNQNQTTPGGGSPPLSPTSQQQNQQHLSQPPQPQPQPPQLGRYGRGDPQYLHQTGGVAVRVRPGQGFAWVLNRLRVSDLALSLEQRFQLGHSMLADFSLEVERLRALHTALHARLAPRLATNVATTAGEVAVAANEDAAASSARAGATGVAATAVAGTAAAAAVEGTDVSVPEASGVSQAAMANLHSSREAIPTAPGPAAAAAAANAPITSEGSDDEHAPGPENQGLFAPSPHEGNSKSSQRAISGENVHCGNELPQEKRKGGVKSLHSPKASVKDMHTAYVLLLNRVWQFVDQLPDSTEAEA